MLKCCYFIYHRKIFSIYDQQFYKESLPILNRFKMQVYRSDKNSLAPQSRLCELQEFSICFLNMIDALVASIRNMTVVKTVCLC